MSRAAPPAALQYLELVLVLLDLRGIALVLEVLVFLVVSNELVESLRINEGGLTGVRREQTSAKNQATVRKALWRV